MSLNRVGRDDFAVQDTANRKGEMTQPKVLTLAQG